jgi:SMODS-associated and fused to various effectors sensor domain
MAAGSMSGKSPNKGRATVPVSSINRLALWTRAGGRCQYRGCNVELLADLVSGVETLNGAFVAHIIAAAPDGPRGDAARSHALANELSNVMLLCHTHHRLIDIERPMDHPEGLLLTMKKEHEERIRSVTAIDASRGTHILLYAARIGEHDCLVSENSSKFAVLPDRYPLQSPISLELIGTDYRDSEPAYWQLQIDTLRRQFGLKIGERLRAGKVSHLSVFAIAPQPLLVELGHLLSDIADVEVRQISREPRGWSWRETGSAIDFVERRMGNAAATSVALSLGVSAHIDGGRIRAVLGDDCAIWAIEAEQPGNDVLARRDCLRAFREKLRATFSAIKAAHGQSATIHVFPALPVSMAVEVGRVWMPKADLPLMIYDEHRELGGFQLRHTLGVDLAVAQAA